MEKLTTKDNVCGMINSGELALSFIHNVKEQSISELKDIHQNATEDFIRQGEANEIEKNKEFLGIELYRDFGIFGKIRYRKKCAESFLKPSNI